MKRFVEGEDRRQGALLPHCLDDYVTENNPVRVIEAFIDELDLETLGFEGVVPETAGRPAYHPATLLKIYLYGYLNRVQSSRRLEREAQRNTELMWLTGRLAPDFKTIADFRKDNGGAIRAVCSQFVMLCRQLGLFTRAVVAIDDSKFKAVNNRLPSESRLPPPAESHQRTELGEFRPREGGFPNSQLTQLWERPFDRPAPRKRQRWVLPPLAAAWPARRVGPGFFRTLTQCESRTVLHGCTKRRFCGLRPELHFPN
jgi:transposase